MHSIFDSIIMTEWKKDNNDQNPFKTNISKIRNEYNYGDNEINFLEPLNSIFDYHILLIYEISESLRIKEKDEINQGPSGLYMTSKAILRIANSIRILLINPLK